MWVSAVVNAVFTGLAVFAALELHRKLGKVRDNYGGRLTIEGLRQEIAAITSDQKPEFMLPMDDAEYEQHMLDESGRGELLKKVKSAFSWRSKAKTSQSSDT